MIPPVEIRQVRPCFECIHYAIILNTYPKCLIDIVRWDIEDECAGVNVKHHTTPCKYNMYLSELKKLIDSGAV